MTFMAVGKKGKHFIATHILDPLNKKSFTSELGNIPLAWGEQSLLQTFYFTIKTLAGKHTLVGECEAHYNSQYLAWEIHPVSW